ncbi:MAG: hypothetical protein GY757_05190, partial [bacterium]|nr:hypothetical protein [bacterium]
KPGEKPKLADYYKTGMELDENESRSLTNEANRAYGTEINDLLLSALGLALKESIKIKNPLVALEGHGRDSLEGKINSTRSVGWYTSLYPVILETEEQDDIRKHICRTKENLRKVPGIGSGYGVLRYLAELPETAQKSLEIEPGIGFNYMGRFDEDLAKNGFKRSHYGTGESKNPESQQPYRININAIMENSRLVFYIKADLKTTPRETIEHFRETFKLKLQTVARHCAGIKETVPTPSDYDAPELTFRDLEQISTKYPDNINNIYNLSPMQEGMLFLYLMDPESRAYRIQLIYELTGDVNTDLFKASLDRLIDKHDVFRTALEYGEMDKPRQVVLKTAGTGELPGIEFQYLELTNPEERKDETGNVKEINEIIQRNREKGFDLQKDKLVRFTLLKTDPGKYRLLITYHHIIMDGWSINIWMKDLLSIYGEAKKGDTPQIGKPKIGTGAGEKYEYGDYLRWLEEQNMERASGYWRENLKGFDQATRLIPYEKTVKTGFIRQEHTVALDRENTSGLTG